MSMKPPRSLRLLLAGAAALAAALPCVLARGVTSGDMTQDRYRTILERAPFGPPPPPPVVEPPEPPGGTNDVDDTKDVPYVIPPGLDKIKITLLSRYRGTPAAGFVDGESGKSYYLLEGQEFDGIVCKGIDYARATVMLAKGEYEAELPLWVNPATTNCADVTTFGQPGGVSVDLASLPSKPEWEREREQTEARQRMGERRAEARARLEARRKELEESRQHGEEISRLSPEERERRMQDIAVDVIVNGGKPLPVDLDAESARKLREAGFDVPEGAGEGAPRRIGIPGGGRRPPFRGRNRTGSHPD